MSEANQTATDNIDLVAEIVAAYVGNHNIAVADIPQLVSTVALSLNNSGTATPEPEEVREPAVPIRRSVQGDHIVCLEDGRKFKSLKRHLRTKYNMSPEDYRKKWGLPTDYPMVAPDYAKARSDLAKQMGLGQGGRRGGRAGAEEPKTTTGRGRRKAQDADTSANADA